MQDRGVFLGPYRWARHPGQRHQADGTDLRIPCRLLPPRVLSEEVLSNNGFEMRIVVTPIWQLTLLHHRHPLAC